MQNPLGFPCYAPARDRQSLGHWQYVKGSCIWTANQYKSLTYIKSEKKNNFKFEHQVKIIRADIWNREKLAIKFFLKWGTLGTYSKVKSQRILCTQTVNDDSSKQWWESWWSNTY